MAPVILNTQTEETLTVRQLVEVLLKLDQHMKVYHGNAYLTEFAETLGGVRVVTLIDTQENVVLIGPNEKRPCGYEYREEDNDN